MRVLFYLRVTSAFAVARAFNSLNFLSLFRPVTKLSISPAIKAMHMNMLKNISSALSSLTSRLKNIASKPMLKAYRRRKPKTAALLSHIDLIILCLTSLSLAIYHHKLYGFDFKTFFAYASFALFFVRICVQAFYAHIALTDKHFSHEYRRELLQKIGSKKSNL